MTKEEAIKRIIDIRKIYARYVEIVTENENEALDMAIEALKQDPCEDAISRQAVIEQTYNWSKDEFLRVTNPFDYLRKRINSLPSVKLQEPKEGCWIEVIDEIDSLGNKTWHYECSICRSGNSGWGNYKYCPDCGTKMKVVSKQK